MSIRPTMQGNRKIPDRHCRFNFQCRVCYQCLWSSNILSRSYSVQGSTDRQVGYIWPTKVRWSKIKPVPLLTFSKPDNAKHYHIMYPAWTFWQGGPAIQTHPSGLGRWDLLRDEMITAGDEIPWNDKADKGFFRGSRTSKTRDPLVLLSRKKPNLVDAAYTKNQAWKSIEDTLGHEPADVVSLPDHCQFKWLGWQILHARYNLYENLFETDDDIWNVSTSEVHSVESSLDDCISVNTSDDIWFGLSDTTIMIYRCFYHIAYMII